MRLLWSGGSGCLTKGTAQCPYLRQDQSAYDTCDGCPKPDYDAMQDGDYGQLVYAAVEWRTMIADGLAVSPDDIPADEYNALRVLREEEPAERVDPLENAKQQYRPSRNA